MKKPRPFHDRLLVRRFAKKQTAKGAIVIPGTAEEKSQQGELLAVGNGRPLDDGSKLPLDVKAGDKSLFGRYTGTVINIDEIDGEEVLILREGELLAVVG